MERSARIAVVGPVADALVAALRLLPLRPEVRSFTSVGDDSDALARFHPELIVVQFGASAPEEVGALRLLRQLWPALGILVVASPATELQEAAHAARIGGRLFVDQGIPGQLAAVIEQALHGSDRPRADVFVDLAHGIADEINNPLLFVAGHLQLLRSGLDTAAEAPRRAQVDAALAGLERIRIAVERLRLCSTAANGPRRRQELDLADLLQAAVAARPRQGEDLAQVHLPGGPCMLHGDPEQLAAGMTAALQVADDLAIAGAHVTLELVARTGVLLLRLVADGEALARWRLPQTFEPYYPSRLLQGQSHGLGLFLLQTVVLGHRGQATARRTGPDAIQLDFLLPAP